MIEHQPFTLDEFDRPIWIPFYIIEFCTINSEQNKDYGLVLGLDERRLEIRL